MEPEQIADVLDDAADYIEANGWCQEAGTGDGRVCALTALCLVAMERTQRGEGSVGHAYTVLADVINADSLELGSGVNVVHWNDAPGRTQQEVLDAFRAAAKQQRIRLAQAAAQVDLIGGVGL